MNCNWEEKWSGQWETDCGQAFEFIDLGPSENGFIYCPYCGIRISEQPYKPDDEVSEDKCECGADESCEYTGSFLPALKKYGEKMILEENEKLRQKNERLRLLLIDCKAVLEAAYHNADSCRVARNLDELIQKIEGEL